jgi:beta-lactamase regulating signal transducer with metallopeptidase domain
LKLVTPPSLSVTVWTTAAAEDSRADVPTAAESMHMVDTAASAKASLKAPVPASASAPSIPELVLSDAPVDAPPPEDVVVGAAASARFFEPGLNDPADTTQQLDAGADAGAWETLSAALTVVWLLGCVCWLAVAGGRLARFNRLLKHAEAAPILLRSLATELAGRMGVRCPPVVVVPGAITPLVWCCWGKPRLVVPAALVERLDLEQVRTLLAHELAHVRRRDHWVRWVEFAVLAAYWWCPLAWWARQQLQQAEEECCDAWVVWALPEAARSYAAALVDTVDFLSGARPVLPVAASGLGHLHLLKRRLTMILRGTTPRALSGGGLAVVLLLGAALLPLMPTWAQEPPRPPEPPSPPELPAQVQPGVDTDDPKPRPTPAQRLPKTQRPEEGDTRAELERELRAMQREMAALQDQIAKKQRRIVELSQRLGQAPRDAALQYPPPRAAIPMTPPRYVVPQPPMAVAPPQIDRRPDLERRIDNLERKLDAVLNQLQGRQPSATPSPRPAVPRTPLAPLPPTQPRPAPGAETPRPGADNLPLQTPAPAAAPSATSLRRR